MHADFSSAPIAEHHILRDTFEDVAELAVVIDSARAAGELVHRIR